MAVSTSYPRHLLFGEKEEKKKKSNYLLLFFRNFYLKRCYFFPFDFNFKKMKLISLEYLACYLARYPPSYPPGPGYRTSYPTNIYPLSAWLSVVIHPVISLVICPVIWCFPVWQPCFIRLSNSSLQCEIIRTFLF